MRMEDVVATSGKKGSDRLRPNRRRGAATRAKHLSLGAEVVRRGEEYGKRHGIALSRLVGDFLRALPLGVSDRELTPAVQRLRGVAAHSRTRRDDYREHLREKYREGGARRTARSHR